YAPGSVIQECAAAYRHMVGKGDPQSCAGGVAYRYPLERDVVRLGDQDGVPAVAAAFDDAPCVRIVVALIDFPLWGGNGSERWPDMVKHLKTERWPGCCHRRVPLLKWWLRN